MSNEPWIETVADEDAEGGLKDLYDASRARAGKVFNIVRLTSLRPDHTATSMTLYRQVMFGSSGLSRFEREMVATVVSEVNGRFY